MRVTRETRIETRRRLLEAARALFAEVGFAAAGTREVARRAGVAAGTLFNYFPSKEALGAALLAQAAEAAEAEFEARRSPGGTLEETLFAWVAIQLRHLEPFRPWAAEALDSAASLLRAPTTSATPASGEAGRFSRPSPRARRPVARRAGRRGGEPARPAPLLDALPRSPRLLDPGRLAPPWRPRWPCWTARWDSSRAASPKRWTGDASHDDATADAGRA